MAARYGAAPALLGAVYIAVTGSPWPAAWAFLCGVVGALYWTMLQKFAPISFKVSIPFTDTKLHIDGARIAEFIAGTVIIGGVSLL